MNLLNTHLLLNNLRKISQAQILSPSSGGPWNRKNRRTVVLSLRTGAAHAMNQWYLHHGSGSLWTHVKPWNVKGMVLTELILEYYLFKSFRMQLSYLRGGGYNPDHPGHGSLLSGTVISTKDIQTETQATFSSLFLREINKLHSPET